MTGPDRVLIDKASPDVLNGCAYCLDVHVRDALRGGEPAQRLAVLSAWRDTDVFTDLERAALTLAEAVTMNAFNRVSIISGHPVRPQPDEPAATGGTAT